MSYLFFSVSTSSLSPTEWSFLTYVVNIDDGVSVYFNAVKEGFLSMASATYKANPDVLSCSGVHIGAKDFRGEFELDGDLDEIKYFYRELSPAGE